VSRESSDDVLKIYIPEKNAVGIPLEELKEDSGDTGGELMLRLPSDPIATKYMKQMYVHIIRKQQM